MELRPELVPPVLDEATVVRLSVLAARLDGARPGEWEEDLAEFNKMARTDMQLVDFRGIYRAEEHEDWVRRLLCHEHVKPAKNVTREELIEILRRATAPDIHIHEREAYMAIFDANVPLEKASNLLFYPPDYDSATNTGDGGRPISEYNPTLEQIVDWALAGGTSDRE
jgi:hypothetical protein